MDSDVMGRSFRRSAPRLWLTGCCAVFFIVFASGLISSWANPDEPASLVQQLALAPFAGLSLWVTVGVFRQGIWLDADGVTIRNFFKRYRIAWADIETIEPPLRYGALRNTGIGFRLRDGRRVNAALFAAGPLNRPGFGDKVLSALRDELARHVGHRGEETAASAHERRGKAVRTTARFWSRYGEFGFVLGAVMAIAGAATHDWLLVVLGAGVVLTSVRLTMAWRRKRSEAPSEAS